MSNKKPTSINMLISIVIGILSLIYFVWQGIINNPKKGDIQIPTEQTSPSTVYLPKNKDKADMTLPIQPEEVSNEIKTTNNLSDKPELPADLQEQLASPPPELPEDLKKQLEGPPPELPPDLKAQLEAPTPELPDDIKRALETPPRIVSIDEVNNPK